MHRLPNKHGHSVSHLIGTKGRNNSGTSEHVRRVVIVLVWYWRPPLVVTQPVAQGISLNYF